MNRGNVLQSSPVQQMPNWWNINSTRPPLPPPQQLSPFLAPPPHFFPQFVPPPPLSWHDHNQDLIPDSLSQLLMSGLVGDEEKSALSHMQAKKLENWEEQLLHNQPETISMADVKEENLTNSYGFNHEFQQGVKSATWSTTPMIPAASPNSCVTNLSSNMLDFSTTKADVRHPPPDRSSECNSTATGGATKKAKVQPSSTQSTFKARKEKIGDRITALHQLVSPFGKTDTASVLLESIGYIRFLQSQIEALSLPYLRSGSGNMSRQQSVQGERNCLFPEDPGQLLNDNCMKRKGAPDQDSHEESKKDLRSRGLCLVPVSCTMQVGSDNGADYWAPALNGGFR